MQILEYKYDGSLGGQRFEGVRDLPQHAFLRSAEYFFTQAGPLTYGSKTRHVQEPCGGMIPQHRNEPRAERTVQVVQCFEDGKIRLPITELLEATSSTQRRLRGGFARH